MRQNRITLRLICLCTGVIFITISLILLIIWQGAVYYHAAKLSEYTEILHKLIPDNRSAVMEARVNNTMPAFNINGKDFIAILNLPKQEVNLPVGAKWEIDSYPCLYSGSIYDGSLIIGGTDQKGQFDFVKRIEVGNTVYITDMTGNRYSCEIADIQYRDNVDNETLLSEKNDLIIFVKRTYSLDYTIIRCNMKGT